MEEQQSQVIKQRREKADELKNEGASLFPNRYRPDTHISDLRDRFEQMSGEELEQVADNFSVAGRIMARRDYGKSAFIDLKDSTGLIQVYVRKNDIPQERFALFKKLDIGDIIGVTGRIFKTRTNELTLVANDLELVTKSLLPLPEKFHEMNVELKYRQRYVDLIMNEDVKAVFMKRAKIVSGLRRFLEEKGFMEVETP